MAILDINLGLGGSGLNVGRELAGMGVAIMYATGNGQTFEQEMRDSGARAWLPKPYSSPSVPRTLEVVAQLHAGLHWSAFRHTAWSFWTDGYRVNDAASPCPGTCPKWALEATPALTGQGSALLTAAEHTH